MIIYYTDNKFKEPMCSIVRNYIKDANLPIVSSSLFKELDFGNNEPMHRKRRGYVTMIMQILSCLRRSKAEFVFFCEHDVLYHKSHFDFVPPKDDRYYYNTNCWRWSVGSTTAFRHNGMISLSSMCCNRQLALDHYEAKMKTMKELGFDKDERLNPYFGRKWGFEPGLESTKDGGFSDEKYEVWESEYPLIDIRHRLAMSGEKSTINDFKSKPKWWKEILVEDISGWSFREMFDSDTFSNYTRDKSSGWRIKSYDSGSNKRG